MKQDLEKLLEAAVAHLIEQQVLPADINYRLQISDTKDKAHGDLASNLAMMLAKPAGKAPRDLAEQLIAAIPENPVIAKTEIAGPGFINFFLASDNLGERLDAMLADPRLGVPEKEAPETVVIDYSSPNLAKEMHVGHLRTTATVSYTHLTLPTTPYV